MERLIDSALDSVVEGVGNREKFTEEQLREFAEKGVREGFRQILDEKLWNAIHEDHFHAFDLFQLKYHTFNVEEAKWQALSFTKDGFEVLERYVFSYSLDILNRLKESLEK